MAKRFMLFVGLLSIVTWAMALAYDLIHGQFVASDLGALIGWALFTVEYSSNVR